MEKTVMMTDMDAICQTEVSHSLMTDTAAGAQ